MEGIEVKVGMYAFASTTRYILDDDADVERKFVVQMPLGNTKSVVEKIFANWTPNSCRILWCYKDISLLIIGGEANPLFYCDVPIHILFEEYRKLLKAKFIEYYSQSFPRGFDKSLGLTLETRENDRKWEHERKTQAKNARYLADISRPEECEEFNTLIKNSSFTATPVETEMERKKREKLEQLKLHYPLESITLPIDSSVSDSILSKEIKAVRARREELEKKRLQKIVDYAAQYGMTPSEMDKISRHAEAAALKQLEKWGSLTEGERQEAEVVLAKERETEERKSLLRFAGD